MARDTTGARLSAARRQRAGRTTGASLTSLPVAMLVLFIADTGIQISVDDIDEEIDRDDDTSG